MNDFRELKNRTPESFINLCNIISILKILQLYYIFIMVWWGGF
jgi:hypothetical protein